MSRRQFVHFKRVFLCLILYSFYIINAQTPLPRWGHGAAYIDNKLYIFGGQIGGNLPLDSTADTDELWYLDMTQSFPTKSPPWTKGPSGGPRVTGQSVNLGGSQRELMVVFGGDTPGTPPSNPLAYFNAKTAQWNNPNLASTSNPSARSLHTGATRNDSTVYIYGGQPLNNTTSDIASYSGLWQLDTTSTTWTSLTNSNTPLGRFHHTATILNDGKMYIIGGFQSNNLVDMKQIDIYDTYKQEWSTKTATGTAPPPRRVHQAVGTPDQKIIIYGGTDMNYTKFYNDLPVLDVSGSTPAWTYPPAQGAPPPGRYSHSMTLVGTNVVITFGYLTNWRTDLGFYVFDTTSYTWTNEYSPSVASTPTPGSSSTPNGGSSSGGVTTVSPVPEKSQAPLILGVISASVVAILTIGGILFIVKNKKKTIRTQSMIAMPYESPTIPTQPMTDLATKIDTPSSGTPSPPLSAFFEQSRNFRASGYHPNHYSISGSSNGERDGLIVNPRTTSTVSGSSEGSGVSYSYAPGRFSPLKPLTSQYQASGDSNESTRYPESGPTTQ